MGRFNLWRKITGLENNGRKLKSAKTFNYTFKGGTEIWLTLETSGNGWRRPKDRGT